MAAVRAERRRRAIAIAAPLIAPLIARADAAPGDEQASYWTEHAYCVLARHGLDFRADVLAAVDDLIPF